MRKLATAAAVSLALATNGAFGLGLGEIEMRSALNQPMNAEIRLTAVQPGELDGMIVQLASADAFARAGLERSSILTDLTFSVDSSGAVPVIRVSSRQPIQEPFLNFLLEVDWPQGRMVREYTVLLDPPVFMTPSATERNTNADQPALVQRGEEALVVPTPIERADDAAVEFQVELFDEDGRIDSTADSAQSTPAGSGEIVSLDDLDNGTATALGDTLTTGDGEIVSLTDLQAPNTAALEERAQQAFDLDSIEVELSGSTTEVGDEVIVGGQSDIATTPSDVASDGSTIVSLDDLQPADQRAGGTSAANTDVTVNRGDTLFEIAQNNAISGVSVQQMMLALLAANETAFINNNINLVRAGSVLRVPDAEEASLLTQAQAIVAVGEQEQLWQEYRDQLRGNAATQVAQAPAPEPSAVEVPTAESPAVVTPDEQTATIETASLDEEAADGLSPEARAILENARNEILSTNELRLIADSAPTSTAASATADETTESDAQRLGELNRRLQLAREELSSSRLQSEDLSEQVGELQSTTDNLDALVALRQNEVAQLEEQLALAREASEAAAAAEDNAADTAGDVVASAGDAAADAVELVSDGAESLADNAGDAAASVVEGADSLATNAADVAGEALDSATGAADELAADASSMMSNAAEGVGSVVDAGSNAVDAAGNQLAQVELVGEESEAAATDVATAPPVQQTSWYQDFIGDPKRMMIAGIGGLGLLGVLGTLLFRRKRRDDDSILDFEDEGEFFDDAEAGDLSADIDGKHAHDGSNDDRFNAAGAAAVAGGAVAAGAAFNSDNDDTSALSEKFDDLADSSLAMGSETQAVADATADDSLDKDDTISEVDVYLAYGLHGQAEELLTKAMDRKPNQPEYAQKLLQTYHAQGNSEGFHQVAEGFHARFGGESNPEWAGIAAMGADLLPTDPLYAAASGSVQPIGTGDSDGPKFEADDFLPAQDSLGGSVSRSFANSEPAVDLESDNEAADLMDQSIDPAFEFDESDLEATGDFSQFTEELAAENDGSIDFPGFESAAVESAGADVAEDVSDAVSNLTSDGHDMTSDLNGTLSDAGSELGDVLTMDELDGAVGSADDLTLDLDQLSGDLDLDTDELLNSDLSDLDIPELTADDDLPVGVDQIGADDTDEMDTMLDLAKAYIDMGDKDSASSALGEIVKGGSPEQVSEAETLLRNIS